MKKSGLKNRLQVLKRLVKNVINMCDDSTLEQDIIEKTLDQLDEYSEIIELRRKLLNEYGYAELSGLLVNDISVLKGILTVLESLNRTSKDIALSTILSINSNTDNKIRKINALISFFSIKEKCIFQDVGDFIVPHLPKIINTDNLIGDINTILQEYTEDRINEPYSYLTVYKMMHYECGIKEDSKKNKNALVMIIDAIINHSFVVSSADDYRESYKQLVSKC